MRATIFDHIRRLPQLLKHTYAPERYHGRGRRSPFFEGWYFKLVDRAGRERWAIIPGIFVSDNPDRHHAFVQVLDGQSGEVTVHRYPAQAFQAAEAEFDVQIGPNHFSAQGISLDIDSPDRRLQGNVRFDGRAPWPVRWHSPGIMGPFGLIPIMECYHGVVSLDHGLEGSLDIDGQRRDFSGGRGYIEKDWGQSFPAGYVWMQSNHFPEPGTSLVASIAIIPWLRSAFAGFIVGLWHRGHLHRFATYTGARTERLRITDDQVHWIIRSGQRRLALTAKRTAGGLLLGPTREDMSSRVGETMLSRISLRFTKRRGRDEHVLYEGEGLHSGLEVHGDLDGLLALQR